ncbi:hypothetical protein I656_00084 [Geobacillus sp. WSUCF1]|nr:hypothetical protein I656_00084 [Geobacillus sp. WSUCF1]
MMENAFLRFLLTLSPAIYKNRKHVFQFYWKRNKMKICSEKNRT